MGGLVQKFTLECDTQESLKKAIGIFLGWNSETSHYRTGVDINDIPYIIFMWHEDTGSYPLISPLSSSDGISHQIYSWLDTTKYPPMPSFDGSIGKGFNISNSSPERSGAERDGSFYDIFCVKPAWILYGKIK